MKILVVVFILIATNVFSKEIETNQLVYTIPENVEVEKKERDFTTFTWKNKNNFNLLMIYPFPVSTPVSNIPVLADTMQKSFEQEMAKNNNEKIVKQKKTDVEIGSFKGVEISFTLNKKGNGKPIYQKIYLFAVGQKIYNGQLTATTEEDINVANEIIKSSKIK